jgi:uncharacterized protein YbaR (Trm112 family)
MSHERHCTHCGYWYPVEDWYEDETVIRQLGSGEATILRAVECPGCRARLDAHAPPLRERG